MPQQTILNKNYDFFLETNLDKYKGEWVILCENEIVSHGNNLKKIVEEAKKKCANKKFLITKVPSEETMIF